MSTAAWNDYRLAFRKFAASVQKIQTLTAEPNVDQAAIDEAILESEKARTHYTICRNTLAQRLLPAPRRSVLAPHLTDSSQLDSERVRKVAELVWETSGKPNGTAETDWYRAERIIRRAAEV